MPPQTSSTATPLQLLGMTNGLVIHQALYAAAKLGVADLLKDGAQTSSDLARDVTFDVHRITSDFGVKLKRMFTSSF